MCVRDKKGSTAREACANASEREKAVCAREPHREEERACLSENHPRESERKCCKKEGRPNAYYDLFLLDRPTYTCARVRSNCPRVSDSNWKAYLSVTSKRLHVSPLCVWGFCRCSSRVWRRTRTCWTSSATRPSPKSAFSEDRRTRTDPRAKRRSRRLCLRRRRRRRHRRRASPRVRRVRTRIVPRWTATR